jgi:hypothetical protein
MVSEIIPESRATSVGISSLSQLAPDMFDLLYRIGKFLGL